MIGVVRVFFLSFLIMNTMNITFMEGQFSHTSQHVGLQNPTIWGNNAPLDGQMIDQKQNVPVQNEAISKDLQRKKALFRVGIIASLGLSILIIMKILKEAFSKTSSSTLSEDSRREVAKDNSVSPVQALTPAQTTSETGLEPIRQNLLKRALLGTGSKSLNEDQRKELVEEEELFSPPDLTHIDLTFQAETDLADENLFKGLRTSVNASNNVNLSERAFAKALYTVITNNHAIVPSVETIALSKQSEMPQIQFVEATRKVQTAVMAYVQEAEIRNQTVLRGSHSQAGGGASPEFEDVPPPPPLEDTSPPEVPSGTKNTSKAVEGNSKVEDKSNNILSPAKQDPFFIEILAKKRSAVTGGSDQSDSDDTSDNSDDDAQTSTEVTPQTPAKVTFQTPVKVIPQTPARQALDRALAKRGETPVEENREGLLSNIKTNNRERLRKINRKSMILARKKAAAKQPQQRATAQSGSKIKPLARGKNKPPAGGKNKPHGSFAAMVANLRKTKLKGPVANAITSKLCNKKGGQNSEEEEDDDGGSVANLEANQAELQQPWQLPIVIQSTGAPQEQAPDGTGLPKIDPIEAQQTDETPLNDETIENRETVDDWDGDDD